jgi:hypothetical protein
VGYPDPVPPELKGVKRVSLAKEHEGCAISAQDEAICWGLHTELTPPASLGKVKDIGVSTSLACAVTMADTLVCWTGSQVMLVSLAAVQDALPLPDIHVAGASVAVLFSDGQSHVWTFNRDLVDMQLNAGFEGLPESAHISFDGRALCGISQTEFRCKANYYVDDFYRQYLRQIVENYTKQPPANPIQITAQEGLNTTCVLYDDGGTNCVPDAQYFGSWTSPVNFYHMDKSKGIPEAIVIGGDSSTVNNHACTIYKTGQIRCSYGYEEQDVPTPPKILAPGLPMFTLEKVHIYVPLPIGETDAWVYRLNNPVPYVPELGHVSYSVIDLVTGDKVCLGANPEYFYCELNIQMGQSMHLSITATNEVGSSPPLVLDPVQLCPPDRPSLEVQPTYTFPGGMATLSGQLNNLCGPIPSSGKVRWHFVNGKGSWSADPWTDFKIQTGGSFRVSRRFTYSGWAELIVTTNGTQLKQVAEVSVKMNHPVWTATGVSLKTPQGYTQGGIITTTFNFDSNYYGQCEVYASSRAYNFALTFMGVEDKQAQVSVKKGKGQSKLKMRWNGRVQVRVICNATLGLFGYYQDYKYVTLKANF